MTPNAPSFVHEDQQLLRDARLEQSTEALDSLDDTGNNDPDRKTIRIRGVDKQNKSLQVNNNNYKYASNIKEEINTEQPVVDLDSKITRMDDLQEETVSEMDLTKLHCSDHIKK